LLKPPISRIENNQASLKAEDAEKLARFLNISITDLFSDDTPIISFSYNTIDKGYIHNHYEMQKEIIEKLAAARDFEVAALKEEVTYLRKQNELLINKIGK
jgi:transcriptional regulator with XRE-family HTH domain